MGSATLVTVVLVAAGVFFLPIWHHARLWGGGTAPPIFIACMLGVHAYTVLF